MSDHGLYVQHIRFKIDNIDEMRKMVKEMLGGYDAEAAPGKPTSSILADRDNPGRYVISVAFSSYEEAAKNNDRPETQEFAARMQELCSDITWGNYDLIAEH
ncbi:MAG: hypothetical protein ABR552_01615 [Actinomycetota bacterium]|nr:hypothetical protein [Actinomycetota bacterium]